ncbi:FxLYD domain-containing protein [Natronococcus sp.]|uniref:FxLYD domain-containing protein n=1 Tax=Natronococcus sp. TaxID=35747 RepID=UPI0025E6CC84|nr:FxLYD domain-containing protein [Natronococcus sp.]
MTERDRPGRRTVLASLGTGVTLSLAGCADAVDEIEDGDVGGVDLVDGVGLGSTDPDYQSGTVDVDGEERTDEEIAIAEQFAEQEIDEGVTPRDNLVVADHEFVLEDDYRGSTVQGTVENNRDNRIETIEVRVRVYNDEGGRIGHYLDSTVDLDDGSEWEFEVIVLESPEDVAEYDIAVLGTPS